MSTEPTAASAIKKPRRSRSRPAPAAATPAAPAVHLFQIAYSEATRDAVESGYALLDNLENPRPDWFEYWPIRRFLLERPLDEAAFYGFFSTKFQSKTGLKHADVVSFVARHHADADVVLFSPQPDMGAFFLNVFEQAELFDPGLIEAFGAVLDEIGRPAPLAGLVMDLRKIVFSNYFVARPAFWREWLAVNEALFAICEGPEGALKARLVQPTTYPGAVQRKVFLQERVASLLLATQSRWRSLAHNPFSMGWSMSAFRERPQDAYVSDALKLAYAHHGFPEYLQAYGAIRDRLRSRDAGRDPAPAALPEVEVLPEGLAIPVRHSRWDGALIVSGEPGRLRHAQHGSMATYHLHGDLLVVDWDDYDAELYLRHGDGFRVSTFERDRRGLDALEPAGLTIGASRLDLASVCVALPDGKGSAHVRVGTSDMLVLKTSLLDRDYDTAALPADCDVVVDLGANIGITSIYFADRYPRATIVAVEPARDNFHLLTLNALNRPGIIPVEAAVAPRDGLLDLQDTAAPGVALQAWAYRTVERGTGLGRYTVEALSIPTLMRRYGLAAIDVLKIDIEGAEHALFADGAEAWLPKVGTILVETHDRFVAGTDALISAVLRDDFRELPARSECRVFVRRS